MELDLGPYQAATDAYQDAERDTIMLRVLQAAPEGASVDEADLTVAMKWMAEFQHLRDVVALALSGAVNVRVVDGEVVLEGREGPPLPSLEEMASNEGIDERWVNERLPREKPDDPTQP